MSRLLPVTIGPMRHEGLDVVLRPGRPGDVAAWRRIRLRDEAFIAPGWAGSSLSWTERHTERAWLRELLTARASRRAGRGQMFVIEVDGLLAGQCTLSDIDPTGHRGEFGIWIDSTLAHRGVAQLVGTMVADYAHEHLGLRRFQAPVSVSRPGTARMLAHIGLRHEATMVSYLDVAGRRRDHQLWAIVRGLDTHPPLPGPLRVRRVAESPVVPASPHDAVGLGRWHLGRIRSQLVDLAGSPPTGADVGAGRITLTDLDGFRRSARLVVDDEAAEAPYDELVGGLREVAARALGDLGLARVSTEVAVADRRLADAAADAGLLLEGVLRRHRGPTGLIADHELRAATAPHPGERENPL